MLTGLLVLGAHPAAAQGRSGAQAQDTTPATVIFAVFPGPAGATNALNDRATARELGRESYAVVSKDRNGKVSVQKRHERSSAPTAGAAGAAARSATPVEDVIVMLEAPAVDTTGRPADSSGYAAGGRRTAGTRTSLSQADTRKVQDALEPGTSAIVLVVADPSVDSVNSTMQKARAKQVVNAPVQRGR
jgi:hypothetical protein